MRERKSEVGEGQREREREREREGRREIISSRLCNVSAKPDVRLKLTNYEIPT